MKILIALFNFFVHTVFRIRYYGKEKIPKDGALIICANHQSNWDSVILFLTLPRTPKFMAKKELFKNKFLANFLKKNGAIPVDRQKPELKTMKECLYVLENGEVLGIFPQGTRKKEIHVEDSKTGIGFFAYKTNTPILPIKIESSYKIFSKVDLFVGDLIYPETDESLTSKENYERISRKVMEDIKELGSGN